MFSFAGKCAECVIAIVMMTLFGTVAGIAFSGGTGTGAIIGASVGAGLVLLKFVFTGICVGIDKRRASEEGGTPEPTHQPPH